MSNLNDWALNAALDRQSRKSRLYGKTPPPHRSISASHGRANVFLELFQGTPVSITNDTYLFNHNDAFIALSPSSAEGLGIIIAGVWMFVPPHLREEGRATDMLEAIKQASNESQCPVLICPRSFSVPLPIDAIDWKTVERHFILDKTDHGSPDWKTLDGFYRRMGFEPCDYGELSASSKKVGRKNLLWRPRPAGQR